jgi:anhydro-N-acetylmuramic acid kinase
MDVMLGGEGAPLVPIGDQQLFGAYDICLNLGGIANLSVDIDGARRAYDVSFANMGLNYLMNTVGKEYDDKGKLSARGTVHAGMLKKLEEAVRPLRAKRPSLGREIFSSRIKPVLDVPRIVLADKLRTFTTFCAGEIATAILSSKKKATVFCTGGGAFNAFLVSELLASLGDDATLILADDDIIKYKEAIVFAFLGVLKVRGEVNCLQSVTGATQDSSGGVMAGF